jgi:mycothiol synthase
MQIDLPEINGLTIRSFSHESDYSSMVSVRLKSKDHDDVDELSVLESIPNIEKLKKIIIFDHCNPQKDVLLVEIHGEIVGYVRVAWWIETDGTWLFLHNEYLLPKWRKEGIDDAMLQWAEKRIKEIAKEQNASEKLMFGTNATDTEKEKSILLLRHGYQQVFSQIEMEFADFDTLSTISLPEGFVIKPMLPEHMREIWDVNNEVYSGRKFVSIPTEEEFEEFKNDPRNDYNLWVIAWHGNEIAGLVLSQIEKGRGEMTQVSVREKYRRKGLAQALMTENLLRLKKKEIKLARLHTSGENVAGAKTLYEKVGFKLLKTYIRFRKEFTI